ncbi:MAG TPA: ferric reductase-like transmembrane domain-containing protein [Solirubrobacteraceae bacterium]|nr:ferric reductase-like transmembrane domain-containing protein [Solirubrobacteraceae bacterium]
MTSAVTVSTHLYWITSRAAGTAALILSSLAVAAGLVIGGRLVRGRGPDLRVLHEALGLATLGAILVHAASLLGDGYLRPTVLDLTVPLVSGYKTAWMSMGIVSGWSLVLLGLSYYARESIGQERWRVVHRFTALAWILGIVHSAGEGTDAGQAWFLVCGAIVVLPALVLLVARMTPGLGATGTAGPR